MNGRGRDREEKKKERKIDERRLIIFAPLSW